MKTLEAAAILDVTDEHVAHLCCIGALRCRKVPRKQGSKATRWECEGMSVRKRKALLARRAARR